MAAGVALAGMVTGAAGRVAAQETQATRDSVRRQALDPVVVTATRDARSLSNAPISITSVDTAIVQRTRTINIGEALRTVPGVQIGTGFGTEDLKISIRGFGVRSRSGVRGVAILLDGVPLTEPDGQGRLDLIDPALIQNIEVIRGPASALYGGTASGGVVNIITKSGAAVNGGIGRFQAGAYGFRKLDGVYGQRYGKFETTVQGSWTDFDGFRAHSQSSAYRASARLAYRPREQTLVAFEFSWSDIRALNPGSLTQAEFDATPGIADPFTVANNYLRDDNRYRAGLRLQEAFGENGRGGRLEAYFFFSRKEFTQLAFQWIDQRAQRLQGGLRYAVPFSAAGFGGTFSAGIEADRIGGPTRIDGGAGGIRNPNDPFRQDFISRVPQRGAYSQLEVGRGPVTLTAGLRYDEVTFDLQDRLRPTGSSDKTFSRWSPRAALNVRLAQGVTAYASVGSGWEVPTTSDLTASPDPTAAFNPNLRPMTLTNYEAGFRALVANRFLVDLAGFHADVDGEYVSQTIFVRGVPAPRSFVQNAGRARRTGLEAQVTAFLAPRLDLVASYTLSDFKFTQFADSIVGPGPSFAPIRADYAGRRLPGVPLHRVAAQLRWRPLTGLLASATAEWQSQTFVDNSNSTFPAVFIAPGRGQPGRAVPFGPQPAFALVHASASYRWRNVEIFANVDNVFDQAYAANLSLNDGAGRFFFPGQRRTLSVGGAVYGFAR